MTSTISNQTHRPVSFRGNSGQTWHLPPGVSIDVADVEVADNQKVLKLARHGVIAVHEAHASEAAPAPRPKPRKSRSRTTA